MRISRLGIVSSCNGLCLCVESVCVLEDHPRSRHFLKERRKCTHSLKILEMAGKTVATPTRHRLNLTRLIIPSKENAVFFFNASNHVELSDAPR